MTAALPLVWRQLRFESRLFRRNPSAAFFSFLLPLTLLVLVASVFGDDEEIDVLVPGIAGMSVMAATFNGLAFNVTFLREQGILKRMRGTPIPPPAYFGGLLGFRVVSGAMQVLLVVALGMALYGVDPPAAPVALVVFTLLGVATFGALGVALSHAIPNFDSAAPYVNAVFIPAIFISGVFYSTDSLPPVLEAAAQALPLKHMIDGLAGALVEGQGLADNLTALAALAAWGAAGAFLAVRYFRWE